jgi:transcriptional/translational regulatory protein YebC/TACO1
MAEAGSVAWQFHKKGLLVVEQGKVDEDRLLALALEAGAEDVKVDEKAFEVITDPHDFETVKRALADAKIEPSLSEVTFVPQNYVKLEEKSAEQMLKLMEILDEHDDVQKVHANFDIPSEIMEKVAAAG